MMILNRSSLVKVSGFLLVFFYSIWLVAENSLVIYRRTRKLINSSEFPRGNSVAVNYRLLVVAYFRNYLVIFITDSPSNFHIPSLPPNQTLSFKSPKMNRMLEYGCPFEVNSEKF